MIVLTLFFVIPFERTDLCDIICSQLHINNLIEFGKSLTLSSWRCFLVWLVDRVVHLLSSWGWIATIDYSELPFPQLRNGKGVKKNPFPKFGNLKGMNHPMSSTSFCDNNPPPLFLSLSQFQSTTVKIKWLLSQHLRVVAQWWTLSEGHLLTLNFDVIQPSVVSINNPKSVTIWSFSTATGTFAIQLFATTMSKMLCFSDIHLNFWLAYLKEI